MPTPNEIAQALATLDVTAEKLAREIMDIIDEVQGTHQTYEQTRIRRERIAAHLAFVDRLREAKDA